MFFKKNITFLFEGFEWKQDPDPVVGFKGNVIGTLENKQLLWIEYARKQEHVNVEKELVP